LIFPRKKELRWVFTRHPVARFRQQPHPPSLTVLLSREDRMIFPALPAGGQIRMGQGRLFGAIPGKVGQLVGHNGEQHGKALF